ncbi:MAG: GDSL-type esterase/lipase family protein [Pirellulaceae bacterium]
MMNFKERFRGLRVESLEDRSLLAADIGNLVAIGDSITASSAPTSGDVWYSYRYELWKDLIDSEVDFQFVGSDRDVAADLHTNTPLWPSYQGQDYYTSDTSPTDQAFHEGHPGWTAGQVANSLDGWLGGYTPDVALIHIGTNDAIQDARFDNGISGGVEIPTSVTISNIESMIQSLQNDNANVTIFVAQIIPVGSFRIGYHQSINSNIDAINAAIEADVDSWSTATSQVIMVDHHTGFNAESSQYPIDPNGWTYDDIHPNGVGDAEIASRWHTAIIDWLGQDPAGITLTENSGSTNVTEGGD